MYKIVNKKKLIATIVLDTLGKLLFFIPSLFRQQKEIADARISSILVIRTAYIGDVVMTLPLVQMLKATYPEAKLTFLTSSSAKGIVENNPFVDNLLLYDPFWFFQTSISRWLSFVKRLRRMRFDLVIEARADIRDLLLLVFFTRSSIKVSYAVGGGAYVLSHVVPYPGQGHKVDYHKNIGRYLGCRDDQTAAPIHLLPDEKKRSQQMLQESGIIGPFVAIHPGSRLELKRWPAERFAQVCDYIVNTYQRQIVFIGASSELPLVEFIQEKMTNSASILAGKVTLRELAALLGEAELFVCNDSAPMHIAAAMKTKIVAIFGPSTSVETGPYGNVHRIVEKDVSCRGSCDENRCQSLPFHHCMLDIEIADVNQAIDELICIKKKSEAENNKEVQTP
ncbi:MAG: hypothetical protein CSA32_03540 [Desulfobulbus propionicus]|nr:MAG: hypothetical protein CSA32_03540 [Desulfobulbus propionicus]